MPSGTRIPALGSGGGGGLTPKTACRSLAAANVALTGTQTISGVALNVMDRVLLTAQSTAAQNGVWVVSGGAWARGADLTTGDHASGALVTITAGTYSGQAWWCTSASGNDVVGTDNLSWGQFTAFSLSSSIPTPDGAGVAGSSASAARGDHTHPFSASGALSYDSGTGVLTIDAASGTDPGTMSAANYTKLAGVGAGANVTSVAGKTGVVVLDHATDLSNAGSNTHAQLDTFVASKAAALGLASLDASSRIPSSQLALHASAHVTGGADKIRDASAAQDGLMTVAYATKLNGVGAGANVTSVAGKTGVVTLDHTTDLSNVGTNSHATLDSFVASKAAASGLASLDGATKVPIAQVPTGATSSTVCIGNDSRLSDARTPTAHATSHVTGGADKIRDASASQDGLMTTAYASKVDGIGAGANVTSVNGATGVVNVATIYADGLTTSGTVLVGDICYYSGTNTIARADAKSAVSPLGALVVYVGSGRAVIAGRVTVNYITNTAAGPADSTPAANSRVFLASSDDDAGAGAGKATNGTRGGSASYAIQRELGAVEDASLYASAKTCVVIWRPLSPVAFEVTTSPPTLILKRSTGNIKEVATTDNVQFGAGGFGAVNATSGTVAVNNAPVNTKQLGFAGTRIQGYDNATTAASDVVLAADKARASGVASLDGSTLVPIAQIPQSSISHLNITNIGTNTHAQLDTLVASKAQASGLASLDASTRVVEAAQKLYETGGTTLSAAGVADYSVLSRAGSTYAGVAAGANGIPLKGFSASGPVYDLDPYQRYCYGPFIDDFIGSSSGSPFFALAVAVGAATNTSFSAPTGHPGTRNLNTGTGTTDKGILTTGISNAFNFGTGETWSIVWGVQVPTLSDGTNRFQVSAGFHDGTGGAGEAVDGMYFRYKDSVNGGKWEGVSRNGSTETAADTGITVVAGTWYRLKCVLTVGTNVKFYIDDVLVATNTTNIPGPGASTVPAIAIEKSLGAVARTVVYDYVAIWATALGRT